MPDTNTPNYHLTQPQVGAAENTWGNSLNTDLGIIDTLLANRIVKTRDGLDVIATDPQIIVTGLRLATQIDGAVPGSGVGVYENSAATARWVETRIMAQMNRFFPIGTILMWSGSQATIPYGQGWTMCNGVVGPNGGAIPPDLSDRIVLAAGNYNVAGENGGARFQKGLIPPSHYHVGTQFVPYYPGGPEFLDDYGGDPVYDGPSASLPYYTVCYIMKCYNWTPGM